MTCIRFHSCTQISTRHTYLFAFNVTVVIRNMNSILGKNRTIGIQMLVQIKLFRTCVVAVLNADLIVGQAPSSSELSSDSPESLRTRRRTGANTRDSNEGFSSTLVSKCP